MAQKRFRDYKEPIEGFDHNLINLGMHNPGRYAGFDNLLRVSALAFTVRHTGTGITYKTPAETIIGPFGMVLTPQGVILVEDAPITGLTFDTNAGNASTRYDLITLTHSFVDLEGGAAATYAVLKGTVGNPVKPIIADPLHTIGIGVITIPPGATDINQCTYEKMKCPDSGDGEDARLNDINTFGALQQQKKSASIVLVPAVTYSSPTLSHLFDFGTDGNLFQLLPDTSGANYYLDGFRLLNAPLQEGTNIKVVINEKVRVRSYYNAVALDDAYLNAGYRALLTDTTFFDVITGGFKYFQPGTGEKWVLNLMFLNNKWQLLSIEGRTNNTRFAKGMMIEWYGDIVATFDAAGTSLPDSSIPGWQICNGNLGSPDRRQSSGIGATDVPATGAGALDPADGVYPAGTFGGSNLKTLDVTNIPDYHLNIAQTPHSHGVKFKRDPGSAWKTTGGGGSPVTWVGTSGGPGGDTITLNATETDTAIIDVTSGGSDTPFSVIQPYFATVWIWKL